MLLLIKFFDQNRIENVYDNGYSNWMKENKVEDKDIENVFNGQYNEQQNLIIFLINKRKNNKKS